MSEAMKNKKGSLMASNKWMLHFDSVLMNTTNEVTTNYLEINGLRLCKYAKLAASDLCLFPKLFLKLKTKLVSSLIKEDNMRNLWEQLAYTMVTF